MTVNAALKSLPPAPTLDPERLALLARLTHGLAPADLYWIAAYSAAAAAGGAVAVSLPGMGEQPADAGRRLTIRSEEHTSELQSRRDLVCRLLLEKKNQ